MFRTKKKIKRLNKRKTQIEDSLQAYELLVNMAENEKFKPMKERLTEWVNNEEGFIKEIKEELEEIKDELFLLNQD